MCMCIYIYIEREREGERERDMYIYIYIDCSLLQFEIIYSRAPMKPPRGRTRAPRSPRPRVTSVAYPRAAEAGDPRVLWGFLTPTRICNVGGRKKLPGICWGGFHAKVLHVASSTEHLTSVDCH